MERSLLLLSLALGAGVWLCAWLSAMAGARSAPPGSSLLPRFWLAAAASVAVIVFIATLPTGAPVFAAGHGLGLGFLIGGLTGALGVWTAARALGAAENGEPVSAAAVLAGPFGLALCAAAIPPLWMRGVVIDALCGAALGWLCTCLLAFAGSAGRTANAMTSSMQTIVTSAAAVGVLCCTLAGLGELRGPIDLVGKLPVLIHWSAPGLAFVACLALVLLLALLPPSVALRLPIIPRLVGWIEKGRDSEEGRAAARRAWRTGAAALAILFLGRIVGSRFVEGGDGLWKTKSPLLKTAFVSRGSFFGFMRAG